MTTSPTLGFTDPPAGSPIARAAAVQPVTDTSSSARPGVPVPIHREPDPQIQALRAFAARVAQEATVEQGLTVEAVIERTARTAAAVAEREVRQPHTTEREAANGSRALTTFDLRASNGHGPDTDGAALQQRPRASAEADRSASVEAPADTGGAAAAAETCAEARRVADERCAVAALAREQAAAAREAVRNAQRAYDGHMTRAEEAAAAADPRGIRAAKERAQHAFRDARAAATDREAVEAAARDWLNEINRINRAGREAAATLLQEREAAHGLVTTIERLTVEADAARISAEAAEATCLASRQAVADCEEAAAGPAPAPVAWPTLPSIGGATGLDALTEDESELEAAFTATGPGEPAVLRLLRGDRDTLGRLVAQLGGEDPGERRRWQLALAGLVDAVIARAIEAAYLTFPESHAFWGLFAQQENRDIASALSSLGYRFDGLGGWADDRTPSLRDLSLAVGYAGLDPMRVRRWPREAETAELFRDVTVAADEYLASAAGGLTLGELVSVLGRRADGLADLWNEWGRVRPLLLSGG